MKALRTNVMSLCAVNELSRIAIFRDLGPAQLLGLDQSLHRKNFPAGTMLMTAEQPGDTIYFILEGAVKVHVEQTDGTDVIISILGPGDMIGELSALDGQGRSAGVVTLEVSRLMWMDRAAFHRALANIPALSFNLACSLANRLRQANDHIQSLAALETESRIARRLLDFARRYGKSKPDGGLQIPIRLTQTDLGALVGATREHTNKIMVAYKERGYLSVDQNHYVTIHDLGAITRRAA
jgi:CRP/FNR family transcriptional regulator, cyclic AMP receptor protein